MTKETHKFEWLLFFYSIPATPVNNRVKIWCKLIKTSAVQPKVGVHILPYMEEHHEALQWMLAKQGHCPINSIQTNRSTTCACMFCAWHDNVSNLRV